MALRASIAAALLLGSAFSAVSAAEAPAPVAVAEPIDPTLPRFEPSAAEFAEAYNAFSQPVVQAVPEEAEEIGAGVASWYGNEFAGRKTASGERFDPAGYTAAHRTLPFGSKVRVSMGDRSVIVRINDRGPFHGGRVIDLSQAAAAELGLVRAGSGRVSLALMD